MRFSLIGREAKHYFLAHQVLLFSKPHPNVLEKPVLQADNRRVAMYRQRFPTFASRVGILENG